MLLAAIVGAGLAVCGAALQAMVRNPLADPYLFGISSGASMAAVATLTLTSTAAASLSLSAAAFIGAAATSIVVYVVARQRGRVEPLRLVLAGVAIGNVCSAITTFLILRRSGPGSGITAVLAWLAGSLAGASWSALAAPAIVLVVGTLTLMLQARSLNLIAAGDETATGLGINLQRFRLRLFALTSLIVGVLVAVSGAIGFVGLMIPHIIRRILGPDHRRLLPGCAVTGALFLVVVDLVGRTIIAPNEVPVGVGTAIVGGPFFIYVMRRNQRHIS